MNLIPFAANAERYFCTQQALHQGIAPWLAGWSPLNILFPVLTKRCLMRWLNTVLSLDEDVNARDILTGHVPVCRVYHVCTALGKLCRRGS